MLFKVISATELSLGKPLSIYFQVNIFRQLPTFKSEQPEESGLIFFFSLTLYLH